MKNARRSDYEIDLVIVGSAWINAEVSEFISRLQMEYDEMRNHRAALDHAIGLVMAELDNCESESPGILDHLHCLRDLQRHLDAIAYAEQGI